MPLSFTDIYIAMVSHTHNVCAANVYIAIVSTIVETDRPQMELQAGLQLLGPVYDKFIDIADLYEPIDTGRTEDVFVTKSYDATSHFETVCDDVKDVWRRATGETLVLKKRQTQEEEQRAMA